MSELELIPDKTLPAKYEQVLQDFGKMCIQALKTDKLYFTKEEINKIVPESIRHNNANVIMGFLIKSNVSFSRSLDNAGDCYQPLHKTFLEFVAAYYLRKTAESISGSMETQRKGKTYFHGKPKPEYFAPSLIRADV